MVDTSCHVTDKQRQHSVSCAGEYRQHRPHTYLYL
nr:MAG TPA: hypothetical protein [Caudoviricetes sp.]